MSISMTPKGILWGRRKGSVAPWDQLWIKLTDNISKAEIKRREKDGWECYAYTNGGSPNKAEVTL